MAELARPTPHFATLADAEKISIGERKELMGHARAEQTLAYTHTPNEQARSVLEALSDKISAGRGSGGAGI